MSVSINAFTWSDGRCRARRCATICVLARRVGAGGKGEMECARFYTGGRGGTRGSEARGRGGDG